MRSVNKKIAAACAAAMMCTVCLAPAENLTLALPVEAAQQSHSAVERVTELSSKTPSESEIKLSWKAVKNADGYSVCMRPKGKYPEIADVSDTSYKVTGLPAAADTYSARPGYSEHQTGMVIDANNASDSFCGTKEAKWLAKNCAKYGFIIRYPKGKDAYTGYKYEPWHIRYVGKPIAQNITDSGLSLEEYFGITSQYKN